MDIKEYVVTVVTMFHPDLFLGCDPQEFRKYPHFKKSRSQRSNTLDTSGLSMHHQYIDGHPVAGVGRELTQHRNTLFQGASLAKYLAEPRLIYIYDEWPRRPKWRLEFRRRWSDPDSALSEEDQKKIIDCVGSAMMRIKGLWINPSLRSDLPLKESINFVCGLWTGKPQELPPSRLRLYTKDSGLWVEVENSSSDR